MLNVLNLKGFSPSKVRVVFFEKITQKISTLSPLLSEILAVLACRQAEHIQNEDLSVRLALPIVPPKTPVLPIIKDCQLPYTVTLRGGYPPRPQPASHLKTRGEDRKNIMPYYCKCFTLNKESYIAKKTTTF